MVELRELLTDQTYELKSLDLGNTVALHIYVVIKIFLLLEHSSFLSYSRGWGWQSELGVVYVLLGHLLASLSCSA